MLRRESHPVTDIGVGMFGGKTARLTKRIEIDYNEMKLVNLTDHDFKGPPCFGQPQATAGRK